MSKNAREVKFREAFVWITTGGFGRWQNLDLYRHSPVRLCVRVRDSLMPEAWFKIGGDNLKRAGFGTITELQDFLVLKGAHLIKKPKPYKAPLPYYD